MILGLTLEQFTQLHVALSLVGIVAGLVALTAFARGRWRPVMTALFLIPTAATTATGFMFPYGGFTPGIGVGIASAVFLVIALIAVYVLRLREGAVTAYAISGPVALYLNMFVLVVQGFQKVPQLNALAPSGSESPFAAAQGAMLLAALVLVWKCWRTARRLRMAVARHCSGSLLPSMAMIRSTGGRNCPRWVAPTPPPPTQRRSSRGRREASL